MNKKILHNRYLETKNVKNYDKETRKYNKKSDKSRINQYAEMYI